MGSRVEDCVVFWLEVVSVVKAETCTVVVGGRCVAVILDISVVALLSTVEFTYDKGSAVAVVVVVGRLLAVVASLVVELLLFDWWLTATTVK